MNNTSVFVEQDLIWIKDCIKNRNSGRHITNFDSIPKTAITVFWGFIEGQELLDFKI